jgi:nucleotide-binding universal stress UspA family protein
MALPTNILYPVDFSVRCRIVWPAVAGMARQLKVPVTVFHAFAFEHIKIPRACEALRELVQQQLDSFLAGEEWGPVAVSRELADGPAAQCIVQRAAEMDRPLIMMPTRGQNRFRQLLLGSVTASVLHDADCPVWTEAHTEDQKPNDGRYRSMVCAIDMGPQTGPVLRAAYEFSSQFGSSLHVIHSVPGIDSRFPSAVADRAHVFLIDKAREDFPGFCKQAGVDLPLEIVEDVGLVDGIVSAAARYGADLLIIGRGTIQGPLGRLRTNAHQLIRHSPCPVLSV